MLIRLQCRISLGWILHQELGDQVFGLVTAFVEGFPIESVDALPDALEYGLSVLAIEGRSPTKQNVQNYTACP